MLYSSAARLFLLLVLTLALLCERVRAAAAATWRMAVAADLTARRSVAREGRLARVAVVPEGELCACDVPLADGRVFRTLARGMAAVDVEGDAAARQRATCSVLALEPHRADAAAPIGAARDFLMERCGGFASCGATVREVVALMGAATGGSFVDRVTVVTPEFEEIELAGDDAVRVFEEAES